MILPVLCISTVLSTRVILLFAVLVIGLISQCLCYLCNVVLYGDVRVATHPGMSRICVMLSCIPVRPAPGRQMSRISL